MHYFVGTLVAIWENCGGGGEVDVGGKRWEYHGEIKGG